MTKHKEKLEQRKTKLIAIRGMLIGLAFVLSWLEAQLPGFVAVPGVKLGLTNLVVLLALYEVSPKDAIAINSIRILLTGLTFGNMVYFVYSLAGGLLSTLVMIVLYRTKRFHLVTVSIAGGVFHNVGQILVAMVLLETQMLVYYLPFLWIGGMISGTLIGLLGGLLMKHLSAFRDR